MIILLRVLFIIISVIISLSYYFDSSIIVQIISGVVTAGVSFLLIILIEYISHSFSSRVILSAILGLLLGLIIGHLMVMGISFIPLPFSEAVFPRPSISGTPDGKPWAPARGIRF